MTERARFVPFKEVCQSLNFPALFREQLNSLPTLPLDYPHICDSLGMESLVREVPAVIYRQPEEVEGEAKYVLWIPSGSNKMSGYGNVHHKVNLTFEAFLRKRRIKTEERGSLSAFIIENGQGELSLIVEGEGAITTLKNDLEYEETKKMWETLAREYGITSIISSVKENPENRSPFATRITDVVVDFIGLHRQVGQLVDIAEKYQMTQSQFLRFKALTTAHSQSGSQVDYETIAKEIVAEEQ